MTDEYRKILDWCDRKEAETNNPHSLMVYRTHRLGELTGIWLAGVREFRQRQTPYEPYVEALWLQIEGRKDWIGDLVGDTPEEAITSLAKALNL
jgi:hypothetical protein